MPFLDVRQEAESTPRRAIVIAQYRSATCCCGARKTPRKSFCVRCYLALPPKLRRPLIGTYGERYELAYLAAAEWLAERFHPEAR